MSFFSELGLAEPIQRALATKGYDTPTPIQVQAIPALLEGRDLLGIAQTGTGKTAAFSLPSLHRLAQNPQSRPRAGCRMLVLSPTRELAAQIAENIRGYAKYLDLNVQCVFGGVPVGKQAKALVPGCDVLVATPGRLLDLIDSRALTLRHVEIFVLDEADQMMDLGFIQPLKRVAALLPAKRQSLFFSATMPQAIAELGRQFIHNPVKVEVTPQATTAERVVQTAILLNQAEKQALLTLKLRAGLGDGGEIDRALVFTRTKHGADRVARHLAPAGISVAAIHGNKSQGQRTAAIQGFRKGDIRVLVATDIAARGIDIPGVSHVFNFEIPNVPEQYVHRIGRTARNGADGVAESFVAPDERPFMRDIEKLTGQRVAIVPLPEDFQKDAARLPAPARQQAPAQPARRSERGGDGARRPQQRRDRPAGARPERDERRPRREGGEFQPRRERSDDRQPRRDGQAQPRRERAEQPQRSFGEMPRRQAGGEHTQRREGGERSFHHGGENRQPRRDGEARPQRRDGQHRSEQRGEYRSDNRGDNRGERAPRREGAQHQQPRREGGEHRQGGARPSRGGGDRPAHGGGHGGGNGKVNRRRG